MAAIINAENIKKIKEHLNFLREDLEYFTDNYPYGLDRPKWYIKQISKILNDDQE